MSENEDYLEQDDTIPGQKYVCLSFLSPENVLKDKNIYFLHNFLKDSFKDVKLTEDQLENKYKDYLFKKQDELEDKFYEKNNFRTTVRGIKVRGVYDTIQEARFRSSKLQKKDPNFNVYVGQVGFWLPWEPESHKVQEQLNQLMSEYKKNKENKDILFEQDKREKIENMKNERLEAEKNKKEEEEQNKIDKESNENKEKIKKSLEDDDPWMKRKKEEKEIPNDLPELEDVSNENNNTD